MMFPFDFGFIPSTFGEEGDPLDIMALMDAPAHVCLIEVRIIGIIEVEQTQKGKTEANNRLLGVAVHSYDHEKLKTINDVSKTLLAQVEVFFVSYNKQRGKVFGIVGNREAEKGHQVSQRWYSSASAQDRKSPRQKRAVRTIMRLKSIIQYAILSAGLLVWTSEMGKRTKTQPEAGIREPAEAKGTATR